MGAGISSSIVHSFMFAALMGYALWDREFKSYDLLVRFWRPDWARFWEILKVGTPIGLTILAEIGALCLGGAFGGAFRHRPPSPPMPSRCNAWRLPS